MKKVIIVLSALIISIAVSSQTKINLTEISGHVGDSVSVNGSIISGRYFSSGATPITVLNVGAEYPNQQLTLVIYDEVRKMYDVAPEKYYAGKTVTIIGKVVLYKDKPQIVIYTKSQLVEDTK